MKPNIAQRRRARSLLVQALYQWKLADALVSDIETEFRSTNKSKVDWEFFHEVLSAIPSTSSDIDEQMDEYLDRKVGELTPVELSILRLGFFEFTHRIDVPYTVVINEYVDLAKKFGATESHKYINGVLDKAAKKIRTVEISANT